MPFYHIYIMLISYFYNAKRSPRAPNKRLLLYINFVNIIGIPLYFLNKSLFSLIQTVMHLILKVQLVVDHIYSK
jgi:hypothetical protein